MSGQRVLRGSVDALAVIVPAPNETKHVTAQVRLGQCLTGITPVFLIHGVQPRRVKAGGGRMGIHFEVMPTVSEKYWCFWVSERLGGMWVAMRSPLWSRAGPPFCVIWSR